MANNGNKVSSYQDDDVLNLSVDSQGRQKKAILVSKVAPQPDSINDGSNISSVLASRPDGIMSSRNDKAPSQQQTVNRNNIPSVAGLTEKSIDSMRLGKRKSLLKNDQNNTMQIMNQTVRIVSDIQQNFEPNGEESPTIEEQTVTPDVTDPQMLSSIESQRFKQRVQRRKKTLGNKRVQQQAVMYSTLKQSGNLSKESPGFSPHLQNHRYDMGIGIKATRDSLVPEVRGKSPPLGSKIGTPENLQNKDIKQKVRKTVTIDLKKSHDDQHTNSVVSNEDRIDKLNESVGTTDFAELMNAKDEHIIVGDHEKLLQQAQSTEEIKTAVPIQQYKMLDLDSNTSQSQVDNLFLGTPTNRDRPKFVGRIASVNDYPSAIVVLDKLARSENSDDDENENPHLARLRILLIKAMKMSKTSSSKTWTQMTPFERAKIKESFTELLRGSTKKEKRAFSLDSMKLINELDYATLSKDIIQDMTSCLTSKTMQQSERPKYNSPNVNVTSRDDRFYNDDLLIATYGNANGPPQQQPHYEHYIVVEDEQLVQSQQQREAYQLGNQVHRGDTKQKQNSIIQGWDMAQGSQTPKFSEQRGQQNLNIKLQKHKKVSGTSQQRMTSDPEITPRKKIVTKSQATDTQLEGVFEKGKPNSVDANQNQEETNQSYLGLEQDIQPTVTLRESETPQALMSDNQVNVMMMMPLQHLETLVASNNPETIVQTTDEQNVHQTCLNSSIQSPNINKEDYMQDITFEVPDVPKPPPLPKITLEDILALLPPPSEFPNKVKQIHKILPQKQKFLQSPENPLSIVKSTLQAISLTKQHDVKVKQQAKAKAKAKARKGKSKSPSHAKHFIVNNDIMPGKYKNDESNQRLEIREESRKNFNDAMLIEQVLDQGVVNQNDQDQIDEHTSENMTSDFRNRQNVSGSMINSSNLSKMFAKAVCRETQRGSNQQHLQVTTQNSDLHEALPTYYSGGSNERSMVAKSPTHNNLKTDSSDKSLLKQKLTLSKLVSSPGLRNAHVVNTNSGSKQQQVDDITDKSSLYPQQLMISKLGINPDNKSNSIKQEKQLKSTILQLQNKKVPSIYIPGLYSKNDNQQNDEHQDIFSQKNKSPGTLRKQNRVYRDQNQSQRPSNMKGWELTNNASSMDMISPTQKSEDTTPVLHQNVSAERLSILEERVAQHFQKLAVQTSKFPNFQISGAQASPPSPTKFTQMMTHAVLRKSDLQRNDFTFGKNRNQLLKQEMHDKDVQLLKLGGTKKHIKEKSVNRLNMTGNQMDTTSKTTVKLAETDLGAKTADFEQSIKELNNKQPNAQHYTLILTDSSEAFLVPQMIELKQQTMDASEMINLNNLKQHGKSVAKLLQASNSKILSKGQLQSSTSNPNINQELAMKQKGVKETVSLYKLNMTADSHHSSQHSPFKMQGTQAFAATPSKVSESQQSLAPLTKNTNSQMRQPISSVRRYSKLNQTATSGFSPPGDRFRQELQNAVGKDVLNTTNSTETQDQVHLRATMTFNEAPRQSFINQIDDERTENDSSGPVSPQKLAEGIKSLIASRENSVHPKINEQDFSQQQTRKAIGSRSQSLAPPTVSKQIIDQNNSTDAMGQLVISHRQNSVVHSGKISNKQPFSKRQKNTSTVNEPVFSEQRDAPQQQLPRMRPLQVIEGGGAPLHGLKKEDRTPLHKLLTSDMLEEFQSLLGTKTHRRKYIDKKGRLTQFSNDQTQIAPKVVDKTIRVDQLALTEASAMSSRVANIVSNSKTGSKLPHLKFPPFNQTGMTEFLDTPLSKRNTNEHVKRVHNINSLRQTSIIMIDPLSIPASSTGRIPNMQSTLQPMSPTSTSKIANQQQKMLQTNMVQSRKSRASPFQTTGPFSFASPKSKSTAISALMGKTQQSQDTASNTAKQSRNMAEIMPAVSQRYRSLKPQVKSKDATQKFIFNDINKLKRDLRKNSALVQPIFQSLQ